MSPFVDVCTRCGLLRGIIQYSFEDYNYYAFKGIPYAKPPIGELRFKDPLPPESWSGIRDAINYGDMCAQLNFNTRTMEGSDDCLYLNIYTKFIKPKNLLPVMVWIHGGAFRYGSGDDVLYGPDYLLRKDIVLITCNYRLGVLGFLDLDDEEAAGNQGLKDIVMALHWIQDNISAFGGDPNNVTIFGESAGGVAVHFLTLSDSTKGLFHKAIAESGCIYNTWACNSNKASAYRLCKYLGCTSTDPKSIIEFLQTVDCKKLIEAQEKSRSPEERLFCKFDFTPGVDNKSKNPLMPIQPLKAAEKGFHIPSIFGNNTRESILAIAGIKPGDYDKLNLNFEKYLDPITVQMMQRKNITATTLRRLYYGNEPISIQNFEKYVDIWSDLHFVQGVHKAVQIQVERSSAPVYYYNFAFDKEFSLIKTVANTSISGTAHFDEVQYLFSMKILDNFQIDHLQKGTAGYRVMEQMVEMWTNFAKYGRPTLTTSNIISSHWLPVINEKSFRTLIINEESRMENILSIEERIAVGVHAKNKL